MIIYPVWQEDCRRYYTRPEKCVPANCYLKVSGISEIMITILKNYGTVKRLTRLETGSQKPNALVPTNVF